MAELLDQIHIRDLRLRCIIGIFPDERRAKQDVEVNITLLADLRRACQSDDFAQTVDYKGVKKRVVALVEASEFLLIERLAQSIADLCLDTPGVAAVRVVVDKPGALRFARSVAVDITRERPSHA
ncbi:MAG: dihydroneopterin aldolase [Polyangia bacterium]|jgi:dihydroneopterin aldolase/D-erythro-7,8-dihydroneopterin triphosphate epimerase|nr:dihydroneopterin aldolase [Polyangia bacterium]